MVTASLHHPVNVTQRRIKRTGAPAELVIENMISWERVTDRALSLTVDVKIDPG